MLGNEFKAIASLYGLNVRSCARLFGTCEATIKNWRKFGVIGPQELLLRLLGDGTITPDDIRRAKAKSSTVAVGNGPAPARSRPDMAPSQSTPAIVTTELSPPVAVQPPPEGVRPGGTDQKSPSWVRKAMPDGRTFLVPADTSPSIPPVPHGASPISYYEDGDLADPVDTWVVPPRR